MTRTMLRGIRVASKQEPIDRIHRYFEEISADPVVFRWKYKMDETLKTWRRYCLRHNRLLTRAAPYGADSEPRTSESGCAITYDVLFRQVRQFGVDRKPAIARDSHAQALAPSLREGLIDRGAFPSASSPGKEPPYRPPHT